MEKLVIIAFVLFIVQGLLAYLQIKNYQRKVAELKSFGIIGIGAEKGYFRPGNITILVCDKKGNIIRGEKMEGMTVFSRFKPIKRIEGMQISELKKKAEEEYNKIKNQKKKSAMLQALEKLEEKISKHQ